jgi:hypothetical protein
VAYQGYQVIGVGITCDISERARNSCLFLAALTAFGFTRRASGIDPLDDEDDGTTESILNLSWACRGSTIVLYSILLA